MTTIAKFNFKSIAEEQKFSNPDHESLVSNKKTHRSKKKLPGRKQRLRKKMQLYKVQSKLAKEQLRLSRTNLAVSSTQGESVYEHAHAHIVAS